MEYPVRRRLQVTVVGDSDAPPELCDLAENVGQMLARLGLTVVTGGRSGVMEAACRGASKAGGISVGIVPSAGLNDANQWCSVVVGTGLGHARNVLTVLSGDLVIALGCSAGTLSEICFAWIHGKPILTVSGSGGLVEKLGSQQLDARQTSTITECSDLGALERAVVDHCRRLDPNW
jgi:uncharacterized protein (TIGR00725 family)